MGYQLDFDVNENSFMDFFFRTDQAFTLRLLALNSRDEQFEAIKEWLTENVDEVMKREIKIAEFKEYFDQQAKDFDRDDYTEDDQ